MFYIASTFILTELEHFKYPMNKNSIIFKNFKPNKEFLVYECHIYDKKFYQK